MKAAPAKGHYVYLLSEDSIVPFDLHVKPAMRGQKGGAMLATTQMRPVQPGIQGGVRMTLSPSEVRAAMIGGCGLRTLVAAEDGDPTAQALYRAALVKFQMAGMEAFQPAEITVSPDTLVPADAERTVVTEEGVM